MSIGARLDMEVAPQPVDNDGTRKLAARLASASAPTAGNHIDGILHESGHGAVVRIVIRHPRLKSRSQGNKRQAGGRYDRKEIPGVEVNGGQAGEKRNPTSSPRKARQEKRGKRQETETRTRGGPSAICGKTISILARKTPAIGDVGQPLLFLKV